MRWSSQYLVAALAPGPAGTGNIADAVGLGEALRYVEKVGIERIAAWEHTNCSRTRRRDGGVEAVLNIATSSKRA